MQRHEALVKAGVDGRRDDKGIGHRCDDDIEESRAGAADVRVLALGFGGDVGALEFAATVHPYYNNSAVAVAFAELNGRAVDSPYVCQGPHDGTRRIATTATGSKRPSSGRASTTSVITTCGIRPRLVW